MNLSYFYLAGTIGFTVLGQMILKWQVSENLHLLVKPISIRALTGFILSPWVVFAFASAFAASLCWMMAISRMPISKAYPFMAINFPLVAVAAVLFFKEQMDFARIAGTALIMIGVLVLSRSTA